MKIYWLRILHLLATVMPGLQVARTYQRRWLRADLFAGLTIFALLVPQGMAYGELAGVAPTGEPTARQCERARMSSTTSSAQRGAVCEW